MLNRVLFPGRVGRRPSTTRMTAKHISFVEVTVLIFV
jgi:hypothetical protein